MAHSIRKEQLEQYFHLPINEVSKKLGVCATVFKKICRRNGVPRWPHRKIRSLEKMIKGLENTTPRSAEDAARIKQEIATLESKKSFILRNPAVLAATQAGTKAKKNRKEGDESPTSIADQIHHNDINETDDKESNLSSSRSMGKRTEYTPSPFSSSLSPNVTSMMYPKKNNNNHDFESGLKPIGSANNNNCNINTTATLSETGSGSKNRRERSEEKTDSNMISDVVEDEIVSNGLSLPLEINYSLALELSFPLLLSISSVYDLNYDVHRLPSFIQFNSKAANTSCNDQIVAEEKDVIPTLIPQQSSNE